MNLQNTLQPSAENNYPRPEVNLEDPKIWRLFAAVENLRQSVGAQLEPLEDNPQALVRSYAEEQVFAAQQVMFSNQVRPQDSFDLHEPAQPWSEPQLASFPGEIKPVETLDFSKLERVGTAQHEAAKEARRIIDEVTDSAPQPADPLTFQIPGVDF